MHKSNYLVKKCSMETHTLLLPHYKTLMPIILVQQRNYCIGEWNAVQCLDILASYRRLIFSS
jgi:hypothetical protein